MNSRRRQSGQAIMELMILLLSFVICFIGLLLIMGFSIANIEMFIDAKFNAEKKAQYADYGGDGIKMIDFRDWQYTKYDVIEYPIPFLVKDKPVGFQNRLDPYKFEFDNAVHSSHGTRYEFNNFGVIQPAIANNIPYSTPTMSYLAANLHMGKSNEFDGENNALITNRRHFNHQQMYDAFEKIIGVRVKNIDLENNYSNTVFFPAMKVIEKGIDK